MQRVAPFEVVIDVQGITLGETARRVVAARLRADLAPFAAGIVVVHVRLWVGPGGNGPAICQVRVDLRPMGGIALGETAGDLPTAVARASARMAAALEQPPERARPQSQTWLR